jgi:hypothetical protein
LRHTRRQAITKPLGLYLFLRPFCPYLLAALRQSTFPTPLFESLGEARIRKNYAANGGDPRLNSTLHTQHSKLLKPSKLLNPFQPKKTCQKNRQKYFNPRQLLEKKIRL